MGKKKHKRQKAARPIPAASAPEAAPQAVSMVASAASKAEKRRVELHERGMHDDIAYRGPLSYRTFMILGWICMVLAQVAMVCTAAGKIPSDQMEHFTKIGTILSYVGAMALPFLLLSSFATMLNHKQSYAMQLAKNLLLMLGMAAAFYVFILHYVVGVLTLMDNNEDRIWRFMEKVFYATVGEGFIAFNVFVDLFLSSLFLFFLFCRPKRVFTGKWVLLLRLCTVLPIGYELYCLMLKWYTARRLYQIPAAFFPFLTVKPPMTFLVFILLALFVKLRERHFLKNGKTYEEYQAFLDTNRNSWHFSICAAVLMFVAGILDYFIFMDIASFEMELFGIIKITENTILGAYSMGFGKSVTLTLLSPFVLLFSYTRTHNNKLIDLLIPLIGVGVIAVMYVQSFFQILHIIEMPKLNLDELTQTAKEFKTFLKMMAQ